METRTFLAINLSAKIKKQLESQVNNFQKKYANQDINWVNSQNFHLTLFFFGSLRQKKLNQLKIILKSQIKKEKENIILQIKKKGCFPYFKQAHILFFRLQEVQGELRKKRNNLVKILQKNNFNIDSRPWQMHLTFARCRQSLVLTDNFFKNNFEYLQFPVFSLDLMKSELTKKGAIYTIIEKFLI